MKYISPPTAVIKIEDMTFEGLVVKWQHQQLTLFIKEISIMKRSIAVLCLGLSLSFLQTAQATLLESWENNLDGWTLDNGSYTSSFSTSQGVTDGSYSLALAGTAGPSYGGMIHSDYLSSYTTALASAATLSLDVYTPPASFGYYLQIQFWLNNADTGYLQIPDGSTYLSTTIGSETTLTWTIPTSVAATLATSSNPTQIGFQVGGGYTAGNETMYFDNVRTTPVPEPATFAMVGLGLGALLIFRRRAA